ncbi:hypothetical protein GQ42DRAFT_88853 [Ramicandelaber brevisporus]|nr:hypothetical protein GQ42DRAFT_88853 [Ramicandelaber brevisporus]
MSQPKDNTVADRAFDSVSNDQQSSQDTDSHSIHSNSHPRDSYTADNKAPQRFDMIRFLKSCIIDQSRDKDKLWDYVHKLQEENRALYKKNSALYNETAGLRLEVAELRLENERLKREANNDRLKREAASWRSSSSIAASTDSIFSTESIPSYLSFSSTFVPTGNSSNTALAKSTLPLSRQNAQPPIHSGRTVDRQSSDDDKDGGGDSKIMQNSGGNTAKRQRSNVRLGGLLAERLDSMHSNPTPLVEAHSAGPPSKKAKPRALPKSATPATKNGAPITGTRSSARLKSKKLNS